MNISTNKLENKLIKPENKLTDWFPPKIKPENPGTYETQLLVEGKWMPACDVDWDGKQWTWIPNLPCLFQTRMWRGLAQNPVIANP